MDFQMIRDLTQKAYDDAENAIHRTVQLTPDEHRFGLVLNVGANLIRHTLSHLDRSDPRYLKILSDIRTAIEPKD